MTRLPYRWAEKTMLVIEIVLAMVAGALTIVLPLEVLGKNLLGATAVSFAVMAVAQKTLIPSRWHDTGQMINVCIDITAAIITWSAMVHFLLNGDTIETGVFAVAAVTCGIITAVNTKAAVQVLQKIIFRGIWVKYLFVIEILLVMVFTQITLNNIRGEMLFGGLGNAIIHSFPWPWITGTLWLMGVISGATPRWRYGLGMIPYFLGLGGKIMAVVTFGGLGISSYTHGSLYATPMLIGATIFAILAFCSLFILLHDASYKTVR